MAERPLQKREVFSKYIWREEAERLSSNFEPVLQRLNQHGLIPPVLAVSFEPDGRSQIFMERVPGFDLLRIPKRFGDRKFGTDFATKVARVYKGLLDFGISHGDARSENIMYDEKQNKCVFVDVDSGFAENLEDQPELYVGDYANCMADVYLNTEYPFLLLKLLKANKLRSYMPATWESFYRQKRTTNEEDDWLHYLQMYQQEPFQRLLAEKGVLHKIDPSLLDFITRGLNTKTCPNSFEEVMAL